jgi:hypothetical protein
MAEKDHKPYDFRAPQRDLKRTTADASFDRWLAGQMRQLYDQVLDESVPEDLVQLVRSFDSGTEAEGEAENPNQSEERGPGRAARRR